MFIRIKEDIYESKKRYGGHACVSLIKHVGGGWAIAIWSCVKGCQYQRHICYRRNTNAWECKGKYNNFTPPKGGNPTDWIRTDDGHWLCRTLNDAKRYAAPYLT